MSGLVADDLGQPSPGGASRECGMGGDDTSAVGLNKKRQRAGSVGHFTEVAKQREVIGSPSKKRRKKKGSDKNKPDPRPEPEPKLSDGVGRSGIGIGQGMGL